MKLENSVALVTGANGGLGKAYVEALLAVGAERIYAAARKPESLSRIVALDPERVVPIQLDITDARSIQNVVASYQDVTLLINNAGVALNYGGFITHPDLESARAEMEVNYFGTLMMVQAFAPVLKQNGGGAIANVLSILAQATAPVIGTYSASKAAALALTKGIRAELAAQGTFVVAVMPGTIDTEMSKDYAGHKVSPMEVAQATLQAIVNEIEDVYPGEQATATAAQLLSDPKAVERQMAVLLPNP
ncbi:SDR family oxidoreductase [Leptolyngbya sp. FACHB-261]|uniref:SDR family oxidoreductase n=1 Tax=Leptolyngbya sp. FACHB-261 TaxID=2692806 RepID=UPI0016849717|nr:SDR family oxidoreductase [Leptolyngbya sp. FACHB-261]MBD2104298.1 SDR family oxidoreductase [Leptolyngbya sp. FACHB-261]